MPDLCVICNKEEVWASHTIYGRLGVCGQGCAMVEILRMRRELDELKAPPASRELRAA
jgi:hypothetical protein